MGLVTTRPLPDPLDVTWLTTWVVKVYPGLRLNVAVQVIAALTVMLPSAQSGFPDQPVNVEPLAATGVRVTALPLK
jgi:hypothetical protein